VISLAWALGPRSFREFSNAAIRGALRPKPLISRSGITLPRFNWYRVTCMMFAALVGSQLGRWYYGLEWLGVVPHRDPLPTMTLIGSAGLVGFYVWLWLEYRKGRQPPRDPPPGCSSLNTEGIFTGDNRVNRVER
jgi:hypothetical protein